MSSYSSTNEDDTLEQEKKAEALLKLVAKLKPETTSDGQKINPIYQENGDINPETLRYIWARTLAEEDETYSQESKDTLHKFFDENFTEPEKQHIFIIWKYDDRRRNLTEEETVLLFKKLLEEKWNRITDQEREYMTNHLNMLENMDEEEIIISEEDAEEIQLKIALNPNSTYSDKKRAKVCYKILNNPKKGEKYKLQIMKRIDEELPNPNKLRTDMIVLKYFNNNLDLTEEEKISLFRKLLSEEDNLSYEEEQDILTYFLVNNIDI